MKSIWWSAIKQASRSYFFYPVVVVVLLLAGATIALLLVDHWSILLVLIVLWVMMAIVVIHLLFKDMFTRHKQLQRQTFVLLSSLPPPTFPRFPETPIPTPPPTRVLETIDLSSTNVEHFLVPEEQPLTDEQV